jgi:serine/threonine-protein kinase
VQAVLGRGAMGVIYRAHDPVIDRTVALKLVRADLLEGEEREEFLARFRQEAQAAGRCTHPNIVTIHDFALHEGNPFLAMEYVHGDSLAVALRRAGRFAPAVAIAVIVQVLDALGAAHALGIVHRDIKPANILLLADGRVKVTDFGIARIDTAGMTLAGTVLGTPSYMSPEQCRGDAVDGRSDLFSAGAVLFELLSGERPFPGRTFTAITHALMDPAPFDPGTRLAGQPPALVAAVRRALAKRAEERFTAAAAMAAALRAVPMDADGFQPGEATMVVGGATALAPAQPDPGIGGAEGFDPLAEAAGAPDPAVLATIERRLAGHLGPIARHLVREALRQGGSLEDLCVRLGRNIERAEEREAFLRSVLRAPATGTRTGTGRASALQPAAVPGLPPAVLERVQRELTQVVGPIARLLVARAAAQGGSEADLRLRLATHIANAAERAAFLGSDA